MTLLLVIAGNAPVLAHGKMSKTMPANGALVATGLTKIALNFAKPARMTLVKIVRLPEEDEAPGLEVPALGGLPKKFGKSVELRVAPLVDGDYLVKWTAIGKDGHVSKGAFSFAVVQKSELASPQATPISQGH